MLDAVDQQRLLREFAAHLDAADLELVFEQRVDVIDDAIQIDRRPLAARRPRPRQRQQAIDDLRGAEGLALDLFQNLRLRIGRIGVLEQHLRVARNAGQRRVHFVRDAGGEQADGRHLLGDLQLFLETDSVGDVLEQQDAPLHRIGAGIRLQWNDRGVHQQPLCRRFVIVIARTADQRNLEQRGAERVLVARRAKGLDELRVEDV